MTLYADFFHINIVCRILDIYLMEGRKILFRIALAILKMLEPKLLLAKDGEIEVPMVLIKEFPKTCDVDELLTVAHKYTFSKSLVDQYE